MSAATRVSIDMDPWSYATDLAVVLAAGLAAFSIYYSGRLAKKSARDQALERRLDFELGLLAQISDIYGRQALTGITGYVRALIRSDENTVDLLILRGQTGVYPNDAVKAADAAMVSESKSHGKVPQAADADLQANRPAAILDEIAQAIDRRIAQLPFSAAPRRQR